MTKFIPRVAPASIGALAVLGLWSCGGGGGDLGGGGMAAPVWGGPEAIFRANCGTCHGPTAEGGTSWVDLTSYAPPIGGTSEDYIKTTVRSGRPHVMPAIPEQEIDSNALTELAAYVSHLPESHVPDPPYDVTVTVTDEDPWFDPPLLTVPPGTTVRFLNGGATYHPVIELSHLLSGGQHGTQSGNLGPGGVWFRRFDERGDYTFLCGMHPYMRGMVSVGKPADPLVYAPDPPASLPQVPGVGEIWVLAQFQDWPGRVKDGVLQVIDAATWTVTGLTPVGNNPHNLWFDAGSQNALITSWFDTTVSLVDGSTKAVVGEYPVGPTPAHVTSDYAGSTWYITVEGSSYVQVFSQAPDPYGLEDTPWGAPRAWLTGYGPHGIWYSNGRLVVANSMDSTLSIVDAVTLSELARLPAGMLPLGAGADSTGTYATAGNLGGASVSIYDIQNLAWIRDIPVPGGAIQVPFTPDGQKIVAANGSWVTVIDVARAVDPGAFPDPASAIDATIWTGSGAHGVAFGLSVLGGHYAYVTHKFENYVSVVDLDALVKAGDVPLVLTTTGKVSLAGATDTGGNGIAVRPNPAPWN